MNARERMRVAMAKGTPDRAPVMCQLAFGHYALRSGLDPVELWHDGEAFAEALVRLQRRYRFDGILVNLPGRDPAWRDQVTRLDADERGWTIAWRGGARTVQPRDDNPHVQPPDGAPRPSFDAIDPERLFYVEPHDLSGADYPFSWGFTGEPAPVGGAAFFPPWQCATLRAVRARAGADVSIHAEVFSPFSQLMELLGYCEGMMALILDPAKVEAMLDRFAAGAACLADLYARAGCDALLVSSAFVGAGFISRAHYARFELPFVRRVVQAVRAVHPELPIYVHTCGAIGDRLDLLEQTGVDGIDTLDPPPIGDVELRDALARLGKRLFLKGNLDPVHEVLRCTPEATRAAARGRLALAAPGGAYVLSTACSVPPHAPAENIEQLAAVVEAGGPWDG